MPDQLIKACRSSCVPRDLPVFPADLTSYQQKMKQSIKSFSSLSPSEQHAYLRYIYFENKLNELKNKDLVFSLYCYLLEKGAASLRKLVQTALDMPVSPEWNCRHIQALLKNERQGEFIKKVTMPSPNFRPLKQDLNSSLDSTSTQDSENEDFDVPKRLEPSKLVYKVQNLLSEKGLKAEPSGVLDPQTETCIRQYQSQNKLLVDGLISQNLINSLEGKKNSNAQKNPNNKIGGVSLNTKPKILKSIRGFRIQPNSSNPLKFLLDSKDQGHISGVDLEDLSLCLQVYADNTIKNKVICFSLDPWEETNPEGPYQRKVHYPDSREKKRIIEGSRFGELMFECDYLMKQMSLGLQSDSETPFNYPQELIEKGLKSIRQIQDETGRSQQKSKERWSRLWLVCKSIEGVIDKSAAGGIYLSNNIKIEVHARQMEQDSQGKLVDKITQDKSDPCYIFAQKFSDLYPVICKYYPCFEYIKKLYRASALARWIASRGIAIDLNKIKEASAGQFLRIDQYNNRVNSIRNLAKEDLGVVERKVEVDIRTVALRSMKQQNIEATEQNIKSAVQQLIKINNGSSQFYDTVRSRQIATRYVMGGVDMNCEIVPPTQQNQSQQMQVKKSVKGNPYYEEEEKYNRDDDNDALSSVSTSISSIDEKLIKEEDFPFALSQNCKLCDQILNAKELQYGIGGKEYFCESHHPKSCYYCGKIVEGMTASMQGRKEFYDAESFVGKVVSFHPECSMIFQGKCLDKANMDMQNAQIVKINGQCLKKVQEHVPKFKTLKEIQLKAKANFECDLCKKTNKNVYGVCCDLCGLVNSAQVNAYLKEYFNQK